MFGNKKKIEALEEKIEALETDLICMTQELESNFGEMSDILEGINSQMEGYRKYEENKRIMKDSDEPWADFMTELTSDGRVKVKFDWNKAMIQELRRMGFNAQSEEDLISAYFSKLVGEHGEVMSHEDLEGIKNA